MQIIKKSISIILIFISFFLFTNLSHAKTKLKERDYQVVDCGRIGGSIETLVDGGRVDCETKYSVIEYDFAKKHHECLSQALYYSRITGKHGICSLIIESKKDFKYIKRIEDTIKYYNLKITVDTIENLN